MPRNSTVVVPSAATVTSTAGMHTAQTALATRLYPIRMPAIGTGLAVCLVLMTLLGMVQVSRMLAAFAAERRFR